MSLTMANRRPASLLNSVDLPTLGLPAMTITGLARPSWELSMGLKSELMPGASDQEFKQRGLRPQPVSTLLVRYRPGVVEKAR